MDSSHEHPRRPGVQQRMPAGLFLRPLLVALTLTASITAPGQDKTVGPDYEIRLHRPAVEGQRFETKVVTEHFEERTLSSDGKVVRNSKKNQKVEMDSAGTILAVDAKGTPTRVSHQISRLEEIIETERKTLLPPDTTVVAFLDENDKASFEVDGKPAAQEVGDALSLVIFLSSNPYTDDELFGTRERKRPGQSWDLNMDMMQKELKEKVGMGFEKLTGKATLREVIRQNGQEMLVISIKCTGKAIPPVPPGLELKTSTLTMAGLDKFPTDFSQNRPEHSMTITFSLLATGKPQPGGPEVELKSSMRRNQKAVTTRYK